MKNNIKKAFSLIEIIWGVLILAIIIVTVTGIFTGILVSTKKNEKVVVATSLAQRQLEYIKLMGVSDIPTPLPLEIDGRLASGKTVLCNSKYFPPYPDSHGQPTVLRESVDGSTYYYDLKVKDVPGTGSGNLLSIVITVSWDQKENEGKNFVTLELYKSK
jgi:type II secretory pathway pseudopilin PulG